MFKLLSKESNIFSIPVYIIFLLFIVIPFSILDFNILHGISAVITFCGVALAYFIFNRINLTYQTHLPLFLYTFFVFALYPGNLDIGLAVSLTTNSFLLLFLTRPEGSFQNHSYVLVGTILAINFIFLPTTWPMFFFIILHIFATSKNISLNAFRLFLGILLVCFAYLCIMFFLGANSWNEDYLPFQLGKIMTEFYPLYFLTPILLMVLYGILDHFNHLNEKSPTSRFKYTFLLIFSVAQTITITLYMGYHYEYLLLLAFPLSVILSRMLRFLPKYWMREAGLWFIILSLILFKIGNFLNLV